MKILLRVLKYLGLGLVSLIGLIAATVGLMWWHGPSYRPVTKVEFPRTPERVARGKYLAVHVASCVLCHSQQNAEIWSRPPTPGTEGVGSCWPDEPNGFGHICPPNITSDPVAGIGAWSDDEIARAIREEIGRDNQPLLPFHAPYRMMADEDVQAVVAYLRTLPPNSTKIPRSHVDFAGRFISAFTGPWKPQPITTPVVAPSPQDKVAYGHYLVSVADCGTCHTPREGMFPDDTRPFAGGQIFNHVRSANLTPDPTGLKMTEASFISTIHGFATPAAASIKVPAKQNTSMPWIEFSGMTDEDLGSIYAYLRTLKPIHHVVEKFVTGDAP